jgi:hypothetical protein
MISSDSHDREEASIKPMITSEAYEDTSEPDNSSQTGSSYAPSVFSIDSVGSSWSELSTEEFISAATELVLLFLNDEFLKPLYPVAVQSPKIGAERFENNFRRLLKLFSAGLTKEAKTPLHVKAAKLIGARAPFVASNIRLRFNAQENEVEEVNEQIGRTGEEKKGNRKLILEPDRDTQSKLEHHIRTWINDTEDYSDPDDLSSLTEVKDFIVSSHAFKVLRQSLSDFVFPPPEASGSNTNERVTIEQPQDAKDAPQLVEISSREGLSKSMGSPDRDNGCFAYNNRVFEFTPWMTVPPLEWADRIKETIELSVGCPVIWWPLQPRKTVCGKGETRISWKCVSWHSRVIARRFTFHFHPQGYMNSFALG